jgi:hypothetical protein
LYPPATAGACWASDDTIRPAVVIDESAIHFAILGGLILFNMANKYVTFWIGPYGAS